MAKIKFIATVLACLTLTSSFSKCIDKPLPPTKPEPDDNNPNLKSIVGHSPIVDGIFDMKLSPTQIEEEQEENKLKSGIVGARYRWQRFMIQPDRAFNGYELKVINDALYELSLHLCIPVLSWTPQSWPTGDYVKINRGAPNTGCWSFVGRQGGRQDLNLQVNGCIHKDVVMHELIHALGYYHEQSRPDRDSYVNLFLRNVPASAAKDFAKIYGTNGFGITYDTRSIMHYKSYDFSINGRPTILAKDGSQVGSKGVLTKKDIKKLKKMYNCK